MRYFKPRSHHNGAVLVVGLLLLLVITIVAVASMANTHMQERMAGNAHTQALAFEVASGGVPGSLAFFETNQGSVPGCASSSATWNDPTPVEATVDAPTQIGPHTVSLTRQLYCVDAEATGRVRPQYFVLNTGEVLSGGSVIARRSIEVRFLEGPPPGGPDCGAICFPSCDPENDSYAFPNSNAYQVDGNGNPAITTACPETVRASIRNNRIGNYDGGIGSFDDENPLVWPWDSPGSINQFRLAILDAMGAGSYDAAPNNVFNVDNTTSPSGGVTSLAGVTQAVRTDVDADGNRAPITDTNGNPINYTWEFIEPTPGQTFLDAGSTTYGTPDNPQITYIAGNADMRGTVSGAGILIVEGTLDWAGTPPFQGLILVLGGGFAVNGGGQGGNFAGSLAVVNIWESYTGYDKVGAPVDYVRDEFGPINVDFTGGGTALYRYDCDALADLSTDLQLGGWDPQCGAGAGGNEEISARIASWRESLGWRGDVWSAPE